VLFHSCWRSHRCLARREGTKVFIDHYGDRAVQYFDMAEDPEQKHDLARKLGKEEKAALQTETRAWYGQVRGRYDAQRARWLQTIQRPDDSPAIATWEGKLSLLGCTVENAEVIAAEHIWVKCRWRAEKPLAAAWTLVAEVTGSGRTGREAWTPLRGVAKMWTWTPGWSIDDTFRVAPPAYTRLGEAMVSVGWERIGGAVVPTDDGRERVDVAPVVVLARSKADTGGLAGIPLDDPPAWGPEWDLAPLVAEAASDGTPEPAGDLDEETPVVDERADAAKKAPDAEAADDPRTEPAGATAPEP
jgi:hypothetical protein